MLCFQEALQQCPYDPNHRVPARSLDKHSRSCRLRKVGYTPEEQVKELREQEVPLAGSATEGTRQCCLFSFAFSLHAGK